MKTFNDYKASNTISDDFREHNIKYTLSKRDDDLYREENNIETEVIRIKWLKLPNKGDRWKILNKDNKVLFVVEGKKLGKKEREFLRTIDGFNFMLAQFKDGIRSFNALKIAIKNKLGPSRKSSCTSRRNVKSSKKSSRI